jgi:hypothetical protein
MRECERFSRIKNDFHAVEAADFAGIVKVLSRVRLFRRRAAHVSDNAGADGR